jgi:hypothetical protein
MLFFMPKDLIGLLLCSLLFQHCSRFLLMRAILIFLLQCSSDAVHLGYKSR